MAAQFWCTFGCAQCEAMDTVLVILHTHTDRQTDRQSDRQTDRQPVPNGDIRADFFENLECANFAFDFVRVEEVDEDLQTADITNGQLTSLLGQVEVTHRT